MADDDTPVQASPPPMLDAVVAFGRILRGAGLRAGTDRLVEFARAMDELDASRRGDVYWAGRITLVSRPEDLEFYDRAFELFWEAGGGAKPRPRTKIRFSMPQPDNSVMPPKKTVEKDEGGEEAVKLRYSPVEVLRRKDFALYSQEEFAELQRLIADLRLSGALKKSRRLEPAHRGRHDPRRLEARRKLPPVGADYAAADLPRHRRGPTCALLGGEGLIPFVVGDDHLHRPRA